MAAVPIATGAPRTTARSAVGVMGDRTDNTGGEADGVAAWAGRNEKGATE